MCNVELEMKRYRCKIIPRQDRFLWATDSFHSLNLRGLEVATPESQKEDDGHRTPMLPRCLPCIWWMWTQGERSGWKEWVKGVGETRNHYNFSQGPPWFGRCRWVNGLFLGFRLVKVLKFVSVLKVQQKSLFLYLVSFMTRRLFESKQFSPSVVSQWRSRQLRRHSQSNVTRRTSDVNVKPSVLTVTWPGDGACSFTFEAIPL